MLTQLFGAAMAAGETAEQHAELPMPAIAYPLLIIAALLLLMFVTISFSSIGHRHQAGDEHVDPHKQYSNKHDHGETAGH